MIKRLLIANRGEIAIRIAEGAAELGIATVGVHSEDDGNSLHVKRVDEAVALAGRGAAAYLDIAGVVAAARAAKCDAVHPGYGFLAENAAFARACADARIAFVGPTPALPAPEWLKAQFERPAIPPAERRALLAGRPIEGAVDEGPIVCVCFQVGAARIAAAIGEGSRTIEKIGLLTELRAREFYENYNELSFNTPVPWSQGPRRMGTDKNADVLWVGNSWGASLARIDTKTGQTSIIPFPESTYQPYHIAVDQHHNVWGNLWTADRIAKYDPSSGQWTMFDLPTRGTEIRHISLLEKDGVTKVTVPIYRDSKMGVMTLRSESDIAALKAQVK